MKRKRGKSTCLLGDLRRRMGMGMAMAMAMGKEVSIPRFRFWRAPSFSSVSHRQASPFSKDRDLPKFVEAVVEVPQGSFVKRRPDGSIDFVTPFCCPFNYGSVPAIPAADGDPLDAVILGKHLPYQTTGMWEVKGIVKFMDAGAVDNKLICIPCQPLDLDSRSFKSNGTELNAVVRKGNVDSYSEDYSPPGTKKDLTLLEVISLTSFFSMYAMFKALLNRARGESGRTAFDGIEIFN
ncbi:hypothetical protein O6H91_07G066100 [Diphasiastrum complanatum]|uniref:Uncharacterized protein n=1 Tax=Diphasiastrum complanatum TaxID=34168 RepID=A0ACC2D6F1_DIPCM|nr:hypothetical protein O6H91_07G066100 [Diphasiastrum complanatum]